MNAKGVVEEFASYNIDMRSKKPTNSATGAGELEVLDFLANGIGTWERIQHATNLSDNVLGLVLGELLTKKLIWTEGREGVRIYGLVLRRAAGR